MGKQFLKVTFGKKILFFLICQILFAYRNQLLEREFCTKFQLNRSRNEENREHLKTRIQKRSIFRNFRSRKQNAINSANVVRKPRQLLYTIIIGQATSL